MARAAVSASELVGLPGMPGTKRSVIRRAESEAWAYVEEPGRGGTRRLYSIDSLPAATRAALAWHQSQVVVPQAGPSPAAQAGRLAGARLELKADLDAQAEEARRMESLKACDSLADREQRRMDAKLQLVRAFEMFAATSGLAIKQARFAFVQAYRAGAVPVPTWARDVVRSVSAASLERWQSTVRTSGITALAGGYGNRRGASLVDSQPELRDFVVAMLVSHPHARATHVLQGLMARFADADVELPSMRSLERWMSTWRAANRQTLTALQNPDAWKNKFMVAFGSQSEGIVRLNQRWELDSTPGDVMLTDGRHTVIGGIDVFSRRPRLFVSKTSKATAVATLVRHMLLDFGVPEICKTDNGSDYTSKHVTRVFSSLDIEHDLCPPFQPWHKPHIERFFGTFSRDLVELLSGFIGHNVAERSAIEARTSFADRLFKKDQAVEIRMSSDEFQEFCDRWVEDVYLHRPHSELEGRTPFEVAAAWSEPVRRIGDERVLDVLLAEAPDRDGLRTVQKQGVLLDKAWHIAPELEAYVGKSVLVRFDPVDLGRIYVFDEAGFVCIAEAPERTGMNRKEVAAKARELQKKRVQDERRALKAAAKKAGTDQIVHEILRERATAAGKLTSLPRLSVPHTSAGIKAAADAVAERDAPRRTTADLVELQEQNAARARVAAAQIAAGTDNEVARRRSTAPPAFNSVFERAQWLIREGHYRALTPEEQDSLAQFKRAQPASYRRMSELVNEQLAQQKKEDPDGFAGTTGSV